MNVHRMEITCNTNTNNDKEMQISFFLNYIINYLIIEQ
jgi:hypothetical protein